MIVSQALPKAKRILLMVTNRSRRNLRATVYRNAGMEVICATHIGDARELWHPKAYDLVLFDVGSDLEGSVTLCADMKAECPGQKVAWLVGGPEFLSGRPRSSGATSTACGDNVRQLMANACEALPRRGGFLEARWRMVLRRSAQPAPAPARITRPAIVIAVESLPTQTADSFGEAVLKAEAERDNADGVRHGI